MPPVDGDERDDNLLYADEVDEEDKMFIFGGCYTSNERYNDTYILKLRMNIVIQPPSNGHNHPTRSL